MIRRTLTIASAVVAIALLAAPSAMASPTAAGSATATGSCTGSLVTTITSSGVAVTGDVRCSTTTILTLRASAQAGQLTVQASSQLSAQASVDTAIHLTIPVTGATCATAVLVNIQTGATVAATTS